MSFESEFEEFMVHEVLRHAYTGQNVNTEPTFAAPVAIGCRVVYKTGYVRGGAEAGGTNRDVVYKAMVRCAGVFGWDVKDKITLPDGTTPVILDVGKFSDEEGDHHEVVYV